MGCDIHVHIEVQLEDKWEHYSKPSVTRYYPLFALMANVRNENANIEPISLPKGVPNNMSRLTCFFWENDNKNCFTAHHASWLGSEEILTLWERGAKELGLRGKNGDSKGDWWFEDVFGYLESNAIYSIDSLPRGITDVRMVFWFDN